MTTPTTDLALDDIRLGDPALWLRPDREGMFAKLRAERPVSFHEERDFPGVPKGPGFWAVTRYADVVRETMGRAVRDMESFDTAYARMIFGRGVRLISYSADALVFLEACRAIVATGA